MSDKIIKAISWVLLICFYVVINALFGSIINYFDIKNKLFLNLSYIFGDVLITGILIFIYRKDFKDKIKDLKSEEGNKKILLSIKTWLIGLFFMILFNLIISLIVGNIANNEATNRTILNEYSIYSVISMIMLAPICEEIIFRLAISKIFDNKYLYIIFSGLMFGLAHVIGETGLQLLYILPYASLGIAFAYIYDKNKNILCTILMHALHNLACIVLILFI